jgi:opacity protein-like surface antigen
MKPCIAALHRRVPTKTRDNEIPFPVVTGEPLSKRILCQLALIGLLAACALGQGQPNFNRFTFNVGGGPGFNFSEASQFANNSFNIVGGGGMNFNRMFGARAEYMYYNLPIKSSVIQQQGLPGASAHQHAVTINGTFTIPFKSPWGFYGIAGLGWYRRTASADTQHLTTNTLCQPAWIWWGVTCFNGLVSPDQTLSSSSRDAAGFNVGGGVTYRVKQLGRARLYAEARYHRAYHSDAHTSVLPVTFGLRW